MQASWARVLSRCPLHTCRSYALQSPVRPERQLCVFRSVRIVGARRAAGPNAAPGRLARAARHLCN
eukprot:4349609-Alexandrium_andersonii.AAC.1